MSTQIVCTEQTGCTSSGHITAVGVQLSTGMGRLTVAQVWELIDRGEVFYTYAGGMAAEVHKYYCGCGRGSLRSAPDCTVYNNLDNLGICPWAA